MNGVKEFDNEDMVSLDDTTELEGNVEDRECDSPFVERKSLLSILFIVLIKCVLIKTFQRLSDIRKLNIVDTNWLDRIEMRRYHTKLTRRQFSFFLSIRENEHNKCHFSQNS